MPLMQLKICLKLAMHPINIKTIGSCIPDNIGGGGG
jgi:hypothetical protein